MTIPEFLERLKQTETHWQVLNVTDIRCAIGDCPLTAVAAAVVNEAFSPDRWEDAAAALDMDYEEAEAIVDAADMNDDHDAVLRADLLDATVNRS